MYADKYALVMRIDFELKIKAQKSFLNLDHYIIRYSQNKKFSSGEILISISLKFLAIIKVLASLLLYRVQISIIIISMIAYIVYTLLLIEYGEEWRRSENKEVFFIY